MLCIICERGPKQGAQKIQVWFGLEGLTPWLALAKSEKPQIFSFFSHRGQHLIEDHAFLVLASAPCVFALGKFSSVHSCAKRLVTARPFLLRGFAKFYGVLYNKQTGVFSSTAPLGDTFIVSGGLRSMNTHACVMGSSPQREINRKFNSALSAHAQVSTGQNAPLGQTPSLNLHCTHSTIGTGR